MYQKRKQVALCLAAAMLLTACSGSSGSSSSTASSDVTVNDDGSIQSEYVTISQYKSLTFDDYSEDNVVTDDQVAAEVVSRTTGNKTPETVDRAAESGDQVTFTYEGSDGDGNTLSTEEAVSYILGEGNLGTDMEESFVGHKAGETWSFEASYAADDTCLWPGKTVTVNITLTDVSEMVTPSLTDEYIQKISDKSTTVEEFREEVREDLIEENQDTIDYTIRNAVWDTLQDNVTVNSYPADTVEYFQNHLKEQYEGYAENAGISLSDYLDQYLSMTEDEFNTMISENAETASWYVAVSEAIASVENLSVDDSTRESLLQYYANIYTDGSVDELQEEYADELLDMWFLEDVVADFIYANGNIVGTDATTAVEETVGE